MMRLDSDGPVALTERQFAVITNACSRFGVASDFSVVSASEARLPDGWVLCLMGEEKGMPHVFGVAPDGAVLVGAPELEF